MSNSLFATHELLIVSSVIHFGILSKCGLNDVCKWIEIVGNKRETFVFRSHLHFSLTFSMMLFVGIHRQQSGEHIRTCFSCSNLTLPRQMKFDAIQSVQTLDIYIHIFEYAFALGTEASLKPVESAHSCIFHLSSNVLIFNL